jgi:hypothetical protein
MESKFEGKMEKHKIMNFINKAKKVEFYTISSISTDLQIDKQIRDIRDKILREKGKEYILIKLIG